MRNLSSNSYLLRFLFGFAYIIHERIYEMFSAKDKLLYHKTKQYACEDFFVLFEKTDEECISKQFPNMGNNSAGLQKEDLLWHC